MQKQRKKRTSEPSVLETENRKLGRIQFFFNGLTCRLASPDHDIDKLLTESERIELGFAQMKIRKVKWTLYNRQLEIVNKLKEARK